MKLNRRQAAAAAELLPPSKAPAPVQRVRQELAAAKLAVSLAPPAALAAALALLVAGMCLGAVLVVIYTNGRD